jgi:hypothetical protein
MAKVELSSLAFMWKEEGTSVVRREAISRTYLARRLKGEQEK